MRRSRAIRLLLALAVLATAGWFLRDYTTDDTYIHLRYAENLLERGEFAFNPGDATYGATSPVWIFVLAFFIKLGLAPLTAAWVAGALSGLGVVLIADAILERLTFPAFWKGAALLTITSDAWFLRWTFSGMETPLGMALLLLLLWPLVSGKDMGWGVKREPLWLRYLAWGTTAGLLGLVRPEMLVVAPLALPWLLWFEYFRVATSGELGDRWRARPHGPLVAAIIGWLVVTVPWFVYARVAFGRFLPGTASAKSSALTLNPVDVGSHLMASIQQLAATQGFMYVTAVVVVVLVLARNATAERQADEIDNDGNLAPEMPVGVGPWTVWGPVALVGIAGTWATALLLGYAVKQVWVISRYVAPLAPVILLGLSVMGEWMVKGSEWRLAGRRRCRIALRIGFVLTLLLNYGNMGALVVPHARDLRAGLDDCYVGMGTWLRENSQPDDVVAALDIGAVGVTSERHVLDLMGLVSPEILELGRGMGFARMVESGVWVRGGEGPAPRYLVDRCEGLPRWEGRTVGGVRFELIETCTMRGVGLREPQPWTIALYRLVSGESRVRSSAGG